MISAEVQRTLVKSPPELWAELSDEDALARHLCALGAIKITTTKPEQTVEWEAEAAHGKVELKPSGWGTKVTLSVTREAPAEAHDALGAEQAEEQPLMADGEVEPASDPMVESASDPMVEPASDAMVEPAPEAVVESECEAATDPEPQADIDPEVTRRRGFFARLFRRRHAPAATVETKTPAEPAVPEEPCLAADSTAPAELVTPEDQAATAEQTTDPEPPPADLSAELAAAEEAIEKQTTELLNGVLDRLGAAHHRPFSRA